MGFPDGSNHKESAALWATQVLSLGRNIPWRKEWFSSPVFLSGEIPWTEEPCGLQSMRSQRVRHKRVAITFTFNTSQFFYFLISKIVCMLLRICQYLLYTVTYRHYWSQYFLIFRNFLFSCNPSCFISVFSFFSCPQSRWGFSYTVFSKHQLLVC